MSLSNRNTTTKTDYASIEGGYDWLVARRCAPTGAMDKLHLAAAALSAPRRRASRSALICLSACLFLSTTCIVLFELG